MRKPSKETIAKATGAAALLFGTPKDKSLYSRATYAYSQYKNLREYSDSFQSWRDNKRKFYVSIRQDSVIYSDASQVLFSGVQNNSPKNIEVDSRYDSSSDSYKVISLAVDSQTYKSVIDGHHYEFTARYPDRASESRRSEMISIEKELLVTAFSEQGKDHLLSKIEERYTFRKPDVRKPCVRVYRRGSWERMSGPLRPLSSVILRDGYVEHLREDLSKFRESEFQYVNRGLPWHRGYLFDGPPGSGKTSLAKGLANDMNMDLYYLPVSDLESNADLIARVSEIPGSGILLLEDVDTIAATKNRDSNNTKSIDMGGLLNVLDGAITPHGLLTIMTTNDKHSLDSAVIRPGRVDMNYHIGYCDNEQAHRLFVHFYDTEPVNPIVLPSDNVSSAQLTELFKRNMYDPTGAERGIETIDQIREEEKEIALMSTAPRKPGARHTKTRPVGAQEELDELISSIRKDIGE